MCLTYKNSAAAGSACVLSSSCDVNRKRRYSLTEQMFDVILNFAFRLHTRYHHIRISSYVFIIFVLHLTNLSSMCKFMTLICNFRCHYLARVYIAHNPVRWTQLIINGYKNWYESRIDITIPQGEPLIYCRNSFRFIVA